MGRPESADETSCANEQTTATHAEETTLEQCEPQLPPKVAPSDERLTAQATKLTIENGVDGQIENISPNTECDQDEIHNTNAVGESKGFDGSRKSVFDVDLSQLPYPPGSTILRRHEDQKPHVPEPPCSKGPRMTKEFLKKQCAKHKLYQTPHLNDILYLHFNGFSKIENLEEYKGLRCLFLEVNGIGELSGLENQTELRSLYLSKNLIRRIENLDHMQHLDTLDVSHNMICKIENLDMLPEFTRLVISHNRLTEIDDLIHVINCPQLSVLDLQYNRIKDPSVVEEVFAKMPSLRVLYNQGNPFTREVKNYRKKVVNLCKQLTYLDDRPVFPKDRACAEAFFEGGPDLERKVREEWNAREQQKIVDSCNWLRERRQVIEARRREAELREAAETKGLPSDNIKVNPGDIDWLYGDRREEEATCGTISDGTPRNGAPPTGLPITTSGGLNEESTFSAGDAADVLCANSHSDSFETSYQYRNSQKLQNCRSPSTHDQGEPVFDEKPEMVELSSETSQEAYKGNSGRCETNDSKGQVEEAELEVLNECCTSQVDPRCGTQNRQLHAEHLEETKPPKPEPEDLTWMSSKGTTTNRQEGGDSIFGHPKRPNLSLRQPFLEQLVLVNNSNQHSAADDEDSLSTICLSEHSENRHDGRNEAKMATKECNWMQEQDSKASERCTGSSPLRRHLVCEIDEIVEKSTNDESPNENLPGIEFERDTDRLDDSNHILSPKKHTHTFRNKSTTKGAPTSGADDALEECIVLPEGENVNFDVKTPPDKTEKSEQRTVHWIGDNYDDKANTQVRGSTAPIGMEQNEGTQNKHDDLRIKRTQLNETEWKAEAD